MPTKETIEIIEDPTGSRLKVSSQRYTNRVEIWIETSCEDNRRWTGQAIKLEDKDALRKSVSHFEEGISRVFKAVEDFNSGAVRRTDYLGNCSYYFRAARREDTNSLRSLVYVAIDTHEVKAYGWRDEQFSFEIQPKGRDAGIFEIPCRWSM